MKNKLLTLTLLLSSLLPFAPNAAAQQAASAEDEAAIKKVIEGETTATYARDFETSFNYWANVAYISRVWTDQEGKVTKMSGDELRKIGEQYAAQNLAPSKEIATRENWLIRANGNAAFVIFDQHNQYPDGKTRDSVEECYMERIDNEWKIVNVTNLPRK